MIEVKNLKFQSAEWEDISHWKKDLDVVPGWFEQVNNFLNDEGPKARQRWDEDKYTLFADKSEKRIMLISACDIPGSDREFVDVDLQYKQVA